MFGGARPYLLAVLSMLAPVAAVSGPSSGRIVSPTEESPVRLEAGAAFSATVRLRLPLTPPPGVQQPRAWKGWEIRLSRRVQVTLDGASPVLQFPARLVRIRPVEGDRYSVTAETAAWIPPGRYDLEIDGPGFEGLSAAAIVLSDSGEEGAADQGEWRMRGEHTVELARRGAGRGPMVLEVSVPAGGPGVRATASVGEGSPPRPLELIGATWTTAPGPDGSGSARLLRFGIDLPGEAQRDTLGLTVELERAPATRCRPEIEWTAGAERSGPTEWRELAFVGLEAPVSVVWDFGDGDFGEGPRVRHRWIFTEDAQVSATGFDRVGAACTATTSARGVLAPRRGCSCSPIGHSGARGALSRMAPGGLLGFFLSLALPGE